MYWGYSLGACLALPASLLSLARIKRPTREDIAQEEVVRQGFADFADKRLRRVDGKQCAESRILLSFSTIECDLPKRGGMLLPPFLDIDILKCANTLYQYLLSAS